MFETRSAADTANQYQLNNHPDPLLCSYRGIVQLDPSPGQTKPVFIGIQQHSIGRSVAKRHLSSHKHQPASTHSSMPSCSLDGTCDTSAIGMVVSPNSELTLVLLVEPVSASSVPLLYSCMGHRVEQCYVIRSNRPIPRHRCAGDCQWPQRLASTCSSRVKTHAITPESKVDPVPAQEQPFRFARCHVEAGCKTRKSIVRTMENPSMK